MPLPSWRHASGLPLERLRRIARVLLLVMLEIVLIVVLLTFVARIAIPFFAPPVIVPTPTPAG